MTSFFTVYDILDEDYKIKLDINKLDLFKLPYCNTCHSVQGMSINEKLTLFDIDSPYVDRNFIWTCITRATSLKNIQIFKNTEKQNESLRQSKLKQYFTDKLRSYKFQDTKANRMFKDDEFVTFEQFGELYSALPLKCCKICYTAFEKEVVDGKVICNISLDRLDNSKAHIKGNLQILCTSCNIAKSDN